MPATNDLLTRLIKDVTDIRSALRRTTANLPLFDIDNENTPTQITSNQNNYVPGNYDVLRLTASAEYSITGISGGVKGRKLRIFNVGSYSITLSNQSGSSLAANRFNFVNASDFIIPPNGNVLLYYDATASKWVGGDSSSVYDTVNETTPAQITSTQNNFNPGVYEVLRLSSDATRTITGISGGVKGRSLQIYNVGNFNIVLAYESGSSLAANRFNSPSAENVVLFPKAGVKLYYDSTLQRWMIPDAPTWRGTYGMSFSAPYDSVTLSIPNDVDTQITGWTNFTDEWGMWNVAGQKIIIPATGVYFGVVSGAFNIDATPSVGIRKIGWTCSLPAVILPQMSVQSPQTFQFCYVTCPVAGKFTTGQEITVQAKQDSGAPLDFYLYQLFFSRVY